MTLEIDEITRRVRELKQAWKSRNDKFRRSYELRAMIDKYSRAGEISVALNDARVFLDLAIHMLSHKPPTIRVPVLDMDDSQQHAAGGAEVFLHGVQHQIDDDRFSMGLDPWQRAIADFMTTTGWWADKNLVIKRTDGTPLFISEVLDPELVFPEFGFRQMNQIAYAYTTTLSEVQGKAKLFNWEGDFSGDSSLPVEIEDFWWIEPGETEEEPQIWNALVVEHIGRRAGSASSSRVLAIPPIHRVDEPAIPIRTGPAGGWATRKKRTGTVRKPQEFYGEGILESGAPLYDMQNRWATIVMRKAQESIEPNTLLRSNNGRWTVSEGDLRSGVAIPVARDQTIENREKPGLTPEVAGVVMPMLERGIARSGPSDLLLGNIQSSDLAGAGFALSLTEPRILSKLIPYARAIEKIGSSRDTGFFEAFRDGDFEPIVLQYRNDEARDTRKVYFAEWSPEDLPTSSVVNWEVQLSMPDRLPQALSIMRQAIPEGDLLDLDTALENVAKVDDVDRVKRGIRQAEIRRDPAVKAVEAVMDLEAYADSLRETAAGFREQKNEEGAKSYDRAVRRIEFIIDQRVKSLEPQNSGSQPTDGLRPEFFGTQGPRQAAGPLQPGQGIPGAGNGAA